MYEHEHEAFSDRKMVPLARKGLAATFKKLRQPGTFETASAKFE